MIRWATAQDIVDFYGHPQPFTLRAMVLEQEGKPVALGGVMHHARGPVAVMEMKPEAGKKSVLKGSLLALKTILSRYNAVYALRDTDQDTSLNYLKRLGFEPVDENNEVYIWTRAAQR
jgi:hypothetical protein